MEDVRCRDVSSPASILPSDWLSRANGRGWGWCGQFWVGPTGLSAPNTQEKPFSLSTNTENATMQKTRRELFVKFTPLQCPAVQL